MSFIDKLFRWKKKPFGTGKQVEEVKKVEKKETEPRGTGQYAHVFLRPHISEKAAGLGALNQYAFEVDPRASKQQICLAMRDLYGIAPEQVHIVQMGGKQVRFGRTQGATKKWKKAIITLPPGKTIDVYKK